ncbi:MAG: threonine--tRNA ligase [Bacilli bacterium]|jgi:threonyl-tRNA synthetase
MINIKEQEQLSVLNHSCAHLLAHAIKRLYPDSLFWVGPVIEEGFYYDIDLGEKVLTDEDLIKIEAEMHKIANDNIAIERMEISREEALSLFKDDPYKIDLINNMEDDNIISIYKQNDFMDLCRGPHIENTNKLKYFKLLKVSGAYFKGDANNKMLQRVYGICFDKPEDLDEHLKLLEEVKKRDHRKLGQELDLFSVDPSVGPGLILWHPNLSIVREEIETYWRKEHRKRGYLYVYTPNIGLGNLWETSGHLETFKENMYPSMDMKEKDMAENTSYYVKPMNCPFHIMIYKNRLRSYRDLPLRYCELGNVYRYEPAGSLHGMLRVRGFTQDDAHLICTKEQFVDEVNGIIDFAIDINKVFGFDDMKVYLSTRDLQNKEMKYVGDDVTWEFAEKTLREILEERSMAYQEDVGGAKFYGPAIDMKVVDSMGREWQGTTIQLDMNEPLRFNMTYIGADGKEHTPIMLHRTLLGSMERFVGTLIEHYAGAFPLWLAPLQVNLIPVNNLYHLDYVKQIRDRLLEHDIRVTIDDRDEKLGYKMREAQLKKIPYNVIIGNNERDNQLISYRKFGSEETITIGIDEFIDMIKKEIELKIH